MSVGSKNRLGFTQSDISTRHDVLKALVASLLLPYLRVR